VSKTIKRDVGPGRRKTTNLFYCPGGDENKRPRCPPYGQEFPVERKTVIEAPGEIHGFLVNKTGERLALAIDSRVIFYNALDTIAPLKEENDGVKRRDGVGNHLRGCYNVSFF
jgi:hypothetical protein